MGQLVSFAGAEAKGPFPADMPVENSLQRRWTWSNTFIGKGIMAYYAFNNAPDAPLVFRFENSSYASIVPVGGVFSGNFGFEKINDNEWDRADANYILRRIVKQDGSPTEYWQKLLDWYPRATFIVWS